MLKFLKECLKSSETKNIFILFFIFILSRLIFWLMGVHFSSYTSLAAYWQFLDIDILKNDLVRGCFYMHSQPPLFNFFLGSIIKIFPNSFMHAIHTVYLLFGMVICVCIYKILKLNGFSSAIAMAAAAIFILSPNMLLIENWIFYTYPVAMLLLLAAYCLYNYSYSRKTFYGVLFFVFIGLLFLTRSSFHLIFIFPAILLFMILNTKNIRIYTAAGLVTAVVLGLYVKNFIIVGNFGPSSWMGMSLWKPVVSYVSPQKINELVSKGFIPRIADYNIFSPISKYPAEYAQIPLRYKNIPALSQEYKASNAPNYNHYGYAGISKEYMHASKYLIKNLPGVYIKAFVHSWALYFSPSVNYFRACVEKDNCEILSKYFKIYLCAGFWRERYFIDVDKYAISAKHTLYPLTSVLFIPLIMFIIFIRAAADIVRAKRSGQPVDAGFLFMVLAVFYVAVVGNFIDVGENNRFRMETDPLLFLAILISIKPAALAVYSKFKSVK